MFHVGQKFISFQDIKNAVEAYEKANNVKFYRRNTNKIEPERLVSYKQININLVYVALKYHCIRGGPYKPHGIGLRQTSTIKNNCPAHINFRLSRDGLYLEVKSFVEEHNHLLSEPWMYFNDVKGRQVRKSLTGRSYKRQMNKKSLYQSSEERISTSAMEDLHEIVNLDQETLQATESLYQNEPSLNLKESPLKEKNPDSFPLKEKDPDSFPLKCCTEETVSKLAEAQNTMLSMLDALNQNIQSVSANMINMTAAVNSLSRSITQIKDIMAPEMKPEIS